MLREYKGEMYRKFALKLKKDRLWSKFIIAEYYFRFYTNPSNGLLEIYNYIKNEDNKSTIPLSWFRGKNKGIYGSFLDNTLISDYDEDALLSDFFKHYKV